MISFLEKERRQQGLTGHELAKRIGTAPSTISQIEGGSLLPSDSLKRRLARALGVAVGSLFPEFFFLRASGPEGVRLVGADGRVFAFTQKTAAKRAASVLTEALGAALELAGPVSTSYFSETFGVAEIDIKDCLLVDPSEDHVTVGEVVP